MLFEKRLALVLLSFLLVFAAGCEERKVEAAKPTSYDMVRPVNGSNVTDISTERFKIRFKGAGINISTMMIELNGVDVTGEFSMNNVSDVAVAYMKDVSSALVQGLNTVIVGEIEMDENDLPVLDGNGRPVLVSQATFEFYLDDIPPRLTIGSVVPTAANPDGSPATGTTIAVEGGIVDVSTVQRIRFSYPGGSVNLALTTANPVGDNQFNNITKTYRAVLPNYPDIAVPVSAPHFSYFAEDKFKHARTESFMASGTRISRQQALQINDSLTANIGPLANVVVRNAFDLAKATNIFGLAAPQQPANPSLPAPGGSMKNPMFPISSCQMVTELPITMVCKPPAYGSNVMVYVYPSVFDPAQNASVCSSVLFKASEGVTHCAAFINNVELNGVNVDLDFAGSGRVNDLSAILEALVDEAKAHIEIAGITVADPNFPGANATATYKGSLKGIVSLGEFALYSELLMRPDPAYMLNVRRAGGFKLHLNDLFKVPQVHQTSCDICDPGAPPLLGAGLLAVAFGVDFSGNGRADKADLIAAIEDYITEMAGPAMDAALVALLPASTRIATNIPFNDKQVIQNSRVVDSHTVYGNNAHLVWEGSDVVDPLLYSPFYTATNGGLGSLFQAPGNYYSNFPWIGGWGITSGGVKNLDLTFALSSNTVNQWLLARHQGGFLDDFELALTGADISVAGIEVEPTDQLSLTINTHEAPSVQFISEDTSGLSLCNGTALCVNPDTTRPGIVRFTARDLDLFLDDVTDVNNPVALVNVNVDIEFEIALGVVSGRPDFSIRDGSLRVQVNELTEPSPAQATPAAVSYALSQAVEAYLSSAAFTSLFDAKELTVDLSTLPGIGGSGASCAGASQDGEFCVAGTQVAYSALFFPALPYDFALLLRRLTVEPTGSYLSLTLDVRNKPGGTWTPAELTENFMTLHLIE